MRLRFGYVITCDEVIKDDDGKVDELRCSHLPETRQGGKLASGEKVKGIIHWVSEEHSARATVNLYDRLFKAPVPGAEHEDGDFLKDVNPSSLQTLRECAIEEYVADATPGTQMQFERLGYFCVDAASMEDAVSLNRVVTLRDTWAQPKQAPPAKGGKKKEKANK